MKALVCFVSLFFVASAIAEPMHFEVKETGGKCCRWIQATGDIMPDTPTVFEAFLRSSKFIPGVVRLNSRGGNPVGELYWANYFELVVSRPKSGQVN